MSGEHHGGQRPATACRPHGDPSQARHAHGQTHGERDLAELGARLELEGDVTMPLLVEAIEIVASTYSSPAGVGSVLDLGSGPGVGSVALAQRFPLATITAVDTSAPLLQRSTARATRLGVGERVVPMVADLEAALDEIVPAGSVDVIWASMIFHHLATLPRTLAQAQRLLRPGGLIAVLEFGRVRSLLPVGFDVGAEGFVERHSEAIRTGIEEHLPPGSLSLDWPAQLIDAGFELLDHRELAMHLPAPLDPAARRFVLQQLQPGAGIASGHLGGADLELLAGLVDPDDPRFIAQRDDLRLDVSRTFVLARKPVRGLLRAAAPSSSPQSDRPSP